MTVSIFTAPETSSFCSGSVLPIPTLPACGPVANPTRYFVPFSLVNSNLSWTVAIPTTRFWTSSVPRMLTSVWKVAVLATEIVPPKETKFPNVDIPTTLRLLRFDVPFTVRLLLITTLSRTKLSLSRSKSEYNVP